VKDQRIKVKGQRIKDKRKNSEFGMKREKTNERIRKSESKRKGLRFED
jgi:hypothetical protein